MELNEMEKKLLFQVEGDYQTKILNELYMTVRYSNNSEQREAAEGLMAKLRVLSNAECMDLVKDIQKNYRLPYPARTIGEKIAEARQQSGAEKLKGHDIMALERFDPEVKHMIVFDVLSYDSPVGDKGDIGARAPYGYRKDPDNCHKLLIDENTAPVVKQIFEWAYERVALNRIVRNLNEMGIAAPSHYKKSTGEITSPGLIGSGKWQTRTVMKILESEVYTGDLVQGKTKMVDHQQVKADDDNLIIARRTHEPIISHELFTAVQEYRKQVCEESRAVPKRPYTPNIFKGKVFCADCGRSLHRQRAERKKGPDIYWFHCLTNSRVAKDTCKGVMMQETELIATVTTILEKELSVALGMSLPLFQLEARQKQKKDGLKSQMSAKRQEIEKQRRLIRGLYENFVQGILTSDEYFELKAGYEESITVLSGDIEALEKDMDALDDQLVR